jgi:hypothetical protein
MITGSSSPADQVTLIVLGTSLTRKDIAFVEEQKNGSISFKFLEGIDDGAIYPSKLINTILHVDIMWNASTSIMHVTTY